jgi:LysM repeat protein
MSSTINSIFRLAVVFSILLAACSTSPGPSPTPAARDCGGFMIDSRVTCVSAGISTALLQSAEDTSITLTLNGANITLEGTLFISAKSDHLTIATIEGTGVVGASGATRIIQPGAQVDLALGGEDGQSVTGPPTSPYPFDALALQNAPLNQLPRAVQIPSPIPPPPYYPPPPTLTPTIARTIPPVNGFTVTPLPTATAAACIPPEDWTETYTIQRGDTLSRIAQRFNIEMMELQAGNCINDPDRIRAGQVLRLPPQVSLATVPPSPAISSEAVDFQAEEDTVKPGQCTTMRWKIEAEAVDSVYFEDELTTVENSRQVCPWTTTNYTLRVVYPGGEQRSQTITIMVISD